MKVIFIAWCRFSQEFLPEFDKVAGHLYKIGELTHNIFLVKVDTDREPDLAQKYEIEGLPTIIVEQ